MYEGSGLLFDLPLLMVWSACFDVYCWDSVGAVWFRLRALECYFELEQYEMGCELSEENSISSGAIWTEE